MFIYKGCFRITLIKNIIYIWSRKPDCPWFNSKQILSNDYTPMLLSSTIFSVAIQVVLKKISTHFVYLVIMVLLNKLSQYITYGFKICLKASKQRYKEKKAELFKGFPAVLQKM